MNHQRVLRGSLAIPMRHHLTTVLLARVGRTGFRVAVSRSVSSTLAIRGIVYSGALDESLSALSRSLCCQAANTNSVRLQWMSIRALQKLTGAHTKYDCMKACRMPCVKPYVHVSRGSVGEERESPQSPSEICSRALLTRSCARPRAPSAEPRALNAHPWALKPPRPSAWAPCA